MTRLRSRRLRPVDERAGRRGLKDESEGGVTPRYMGFWGVLPLPWSVLEGELGDWGELVREEVGECWCEDESEPLRVLLA